MIIRLKRPLAFVLSGGGARGALQVGALRALLEAEIQPDLLVGTSIGAANAAYLAVHGFTQVGLESLMATWHEAAAANLVSANALWLTMQFLLNRAGRRLDHRLRDFFIAHGITPDLRFGDLSVRLILVAADLNAGRPILYGADPQQSVLEGLLASTALPPWLYPLEKDGQLLIDGGVVSNLPIEPALTQGAREIIALDLADPRETPIEGRGFGPFLGKLMNVIEQRQREVEIALARAQKVPVHYIALYSDVPIAIWDFQDVAERSARGYAIARQAIALWQTERPRGWLLSWADRLRSRLTFPSTPQQPG